MRKLLYNRWIRFAILLALIVLFFSGGRILSLGILFAGFVVWAFYLWRDKKKTGAITLAAILAIGFMAFGGMFLFAQYESIMIRWYKQQSLDEMMARIPDGKYEGEAEGRRGPIIVEVTVEDHKIKNVSALYDQDTVSIGGNAIAEMESRYAGTDKPEEVDAVTGATATAFGVMNAVRDALWKGVPDAPHPSPISDIVGWLLAFELHLITFNTFAILFIIVLFFDYTITSAIVEGTGQSLNCMDCQTCVGACPVKMAEGYPFPMTMVLRARLGDYDTVMSLSKYCVGCSKCSAKCPVGISAPSIAGAVAEFLRKQGRYEEAKFFEERIEEERKVG